MKPPFRGVTVSPFTFSPVLFAIIPVNLRASSLEVWPQATFHPPFDALRQFQGDLPARENRIIIALDETPV